MFEKESQYYAFDEVKHKQEWYIKHPEHSIDCDYEDIKKHWSKGANFGYNKAKVEVEDSYRESLCNSELNLASVTNRLEQAKEIVREFMRITEMVEGFEPDYSELIQKAEVFLKE